MKVSYSSQGLNEFLVITKETITFIHKMLQWTTDITNTFCWCQPCSLKPSFTTLHVSEVQKTRPTCTCNSMIHNKYPQLILPRNNSNNNNPSETLLLNKTRRRYQSEQQDRCWVVQLMSLLMHWYKQFLCCELIMLFRSEKLILIWCQDIFSCFSNSV